MGKEYFVQAYVEIDGHEIKAYSDSSQSRLTFEQAKEFKEQAKERLLSKISNIVDAKNYETKMSEILSSEEVEL
jgi:purine-nucleoside phosphorylase